jgi:hypothetical protein
MAQYEITRLDSTHVRVTGTDLSKPWIIPNRGRFKIQLGSEDGFVHISETVTKGVGTFESSPGPKGSADITVHGSGTTRIVVSGGVLKWRGPPRWMPHHHMDIT